MSFFSSLHVISPSELTIDPFFIKYPKSFSVVIWKISLMVYMYSYNFLLIVYLAPKVWFVNLRARFFICVAVFSFFFALFFSILFSLCCSTILFCVVFAKASNINYTQDQTCSIHTRSNMSGKSEKRKNHQNLWGRA